jgi:thiol-disulfide isomerase/thioredoxin
MFRGSGAKWMKDIMSETNLGAWIRRRRVILNIVLALLSMGIVLFNRICGGSCTYIHGDLFGLNLEYFGQAFMVLIVLLSLARNDFFLILALSAGMGIEAYLIGFQFWFNTYCPYCLAFGGILTILFVLNIPKTKIKKAILSATVALILFAFFFNGSVTPAYAEETLVPSFGTGKIQVRLYTDYFCNPCRAMEPTIEPVLEDLVKKNIINLTLVDTPLSKATPLYARYFLYSINGKNTLGNAFQGRSVLIEASIEKIMEPSQLEEYLKKKGIKFKPFDVKPTFNLLNDLINGDKIKSTPTCVIVQDGKTDRYTGKANIIAALERLKQ